MPLTQARVRVSDSHHSPTYTIYSTSIFFCKINVAFISSYQFRKESIRTKFNRFNRFSFESSKNNLDYIQFCLFFDSILLKLFWWAFRSCKSGQYRLELKGLQETLKGNKIVTRDKLGFHFHHKRLWALLAFVEHWLAC